MCVWRDLLEERRRRCIFVAQSKGLRDRGRLRSVLDTRPEGSLWFALIVTKQKYKWSSGRGVFEGLKRTPGGVERRPMIGGVVVDQESKVSQKREEQRVNQTSSWRHYYLETGSEPISVLDPREWTSGVLESSGRVSELGGAADATRLLPFPYRA